MRYNSLILCFLLPISMILCKSKLSDKNLAENRSYKTFLQGDISKIDIYCFCYNCSRFSNLNDSTSFGHCTTAVPVEPNIIIKPEYLVGSFTTDSVITFFKEQFDTKFLTKLDSLEGILIDSRLVVHVSYKNQSFDTLVINGSGRLILNRRYILEYDDFEKRMGIVFNMQRNIEK